MEVALGSRSVGNRLQCPKTEAEQKIRKLIKEDFRGEVGLALRNTAYLKGKGRTWEKHKKTFIFSQSQRRNNQTQSWKTLLHSLLPGPETLLACLHPVGVPCPPQHGCRLSVASRNGAGFERHWSTLLVCCWWTNCVIALSFGCPHPWNMATNTSSVLLYK